VVVIGAGPAGLTAAAELAAKTDGPIVVLEQDEQYVGGISRTVRYKGYRFDIGGHRFFSKNPEIVRWWHDRLPSDFLSVKRQSRILYGKRLYDYPLRPLNALTNLGVVTSALCVYSYFWRRLFPIRPERTFEQWVSNRFGSRLFRIFFKTYTEKVWGIPCSEISADWASQRIKGLSLKEAILNAFRFSKRNDAVIKTLIDEFQYPRLGPGMMWEKTRDDLAQIGVKIHMGRQVQEIHHSGREVSFVRTKTMAGDIEDWFAEHFISSMPLRDCVLSMHPGISDAGQVAARGLQYRDFITVAILVKDRHLFPDNWIYVHDPDVHVGRIQNYNNWSLAMVPDPEVTCLGLEYFCTFGDTLWNFSDAELSELAKRELVQLKLAPKDKILDACVVRMLKAYPVYDATYEQNVLKIREALGELGNLQVVGRNGMHKYNNQDHSMLTGILAARNVTGGRHNVWKVNTDAEYHEAGDVEDVKGGRLIPRRVETVAVPGSTS
jgi:protoporphyrinogen oxidase